MDREQNDNTGHDDDRRVDDDADVDAAEPPIDLSPEAADLIERIEQERDDAVASRQRALADYANFQRRARDNEIRARQDGVTSVLRSLLPVVDHFDLALGQDPSKLTVEQLYGGVRIVRDELVKAMETHGVSRLLPQPGDEFDPNRHEAMMRQPPPEPGPGEPEIRPNHIVAVLQPGFAVGDLVLRPAKVTVSPEEA